VSLSAGLAGLFASSFASATVLPGNSEIALALVLSEWPEAKVAALVVATFGNTLGGLTTYGLGRFVPQRAEPRHLRPLQRWGAPVLLLSWVPVAGDALCLGAGWLRLRAWPCAAFMAIGKALRYAALAALL